MRILSSMIVLNHHHHDAAKLLKAYFYFHMMDKFGQVPYRDSYDDMTLDAQVYTRADAFAIAVRFSY